MKAARVASKPFAIISGWIARASAFIRRPRPMSRCDTKIGSRLRTIVIRRKCTFPHRVVREEGFSSRIALFHIFFRVTFTRRVNVSDWFLQNARKANDPATTASVSIRTSSATETSTAMMLVTNGIAVRISLDRHVSCYESTECCNIRSVRWDICLVTQDILRMIS